MATLLLACNRKIFRHVAESSKPQAGAHRPSAASVLRMTPRTTLYPAVRHQTLGDVQENTCIMPKTEAYPRPRGMTDFLIAPH